MDRHFRQLALKKTAETLTQMVERSFEIADKPPVAISDEKKPNEPQKSQTNLQFSALGSVGPGTTVMMPIDPINSDGSVNIIINIRGIAGGDTKTAASLGKNAVIITAEAGGLGSKENQAKFGNAAFINQAVDKVLGFLKKKFPDKNIKRGKLVVSGFSGGGAAVASLLTQRQQVKGDINAVIINDGLHANPNSPAMQAVLAYAKESQQDPKFQFNLIHTAVKPGKYISTTETANYLLQQLGLQKQPVTQWNGIGTKPTAQAVQGGVKITQLYDQEQPYMAKDPKTGKLQPNVRGATSGGQHISSLEWMPNAFAELQGI